MQINDFRSIQGRLNNLLQESIFEKTRVDINKVMDERLADFKPTFIIYGVYNSGKSTLLNALLGEERAEMGDTPTTNKIHQYSYGGFSIYDTPGLEARLEDNETAQKHLSESDVVIFVLSSDGLVESKSAYEEMGDVLKANKKLLVVLNNKSGLEIGSEDDVRMHAKIRQNLQKEADNKKIQNITDIQVITVNAKSALKAKIENKNLLLKASNFPLLERFLTKLMQEADHNDVANTLKQKLYDKIEEALKICDENMQNTLVKETGQRVTSLEKQKRAMKDEANLLLDKHIPTLKDELRRALNTKEIDEGELKRIIRRRAEQVINEFEKIATKYTKNLEATAEDFKQSLNQARLKDRGDALSHLPSEEEIATTLSDQGFVQKNIEAALDYTRTKLPEIATSGGDVWPGNPLGSLGNYLAILATIVMELFSWWRSYTDHEEQKRREIERLHAIANGVSQIAQNMQGDLEEEFDKVVKMIFDPVMQKYQASLKDKSANDVKLAEIKEGLLELVETIK